MNTVSYLDVCSWVLGFWCFLWSCSTVLLAGLHYIAGKLLKAQDLPKEEENFQKVYVKAPSFLSIHMGVNADVLPQDTDCHHFVLEVPGLSSLHGWFWSWRSNYQLCAINVHWCGTHLLAYPWFMQDDWARLEKSYGSIFLSIPTVLDSTLAPEGHHILHIFTTSGIDDWKVSIFS